MFREGFCIDVSDISFNLVFKKIRFLEYLIAVRESASGVGQEFEDRYLIVFEVFPGRYHLFRSRKRPVLP
jgi:hypothetical protein